VWERIEASFARAIARVGCLAMAFALSRLTPWLSLYPIAKLMEVTRLVPLRRPLRSARRKGDEDENRRADR